MKVYLLIGNGLSIDFVNYIKKSDDIILSNLFMHGEKVKWPIGSKLGFLSYKYCPALWRLGARPTNSTESSNKIIQDIITCANVYASLDVSKRPKVGNGTESIYLKAYNELVSYLRELFIYYNNQIEDSALDTIEEWPWAKLLKKYYEDSTIEKINIITYNYDIWIERILKKLKLEYTVFLGNVGDKKIEIFKPHGSISFIHETVLDIDAFQLKDSFENIDEKIEKFSERYNDLTCNPFNIPIIPPTGQSSRYKNSWAASIRNEIINCCKKSNDKDILLIAGLSYCFVDREEIDEIIINTNNEMDVYFINPKPPEDFFAVLTTIYKNLVYIPNSNGTIGEI